MALIIVVLQELEGGLRAAEEQKDELKACSQQWMYCHTMLMAGSSPRQLITVSSFLSHVQRVGTRVVTGI